MEIVLLSALIVLNGLFAMSEIALVTARKARMQKLLDQGDRAAKEVSMAKVFVADVLSKAADSAIQLCGARGYSCDTVLEWIYRYARAARILDGASEVHRMVLARAYAKDGDGFWRWG